VAEHPPRAIQLTVADVSLSALPSDREGRWGFRGRIPLEVEGTVVQARVTVDVVLVRPRDAGPETFLGERHERHVERIRSEPIVGTRVNKGGTALSFRLDLAHRVRVVFKPDQRNTWSVPRKEVAAYRVDRLLGLNGVPPSTLRVVDREELVATLPANNRFFVDKIDREAIFDDAGRTLGSASVWIADLVDPGLDTIAAIRRWSDWLHVGSAIRSGDESLAAQLSSMLLYDRIIDNFDRFSGGGLLTSADEQSLYLLDNSTAFPDDEAGNPRCAGYLARCQKFRPDVVEAIRSLDREKLNAAVEDLLTPAEKNALLSRAAHALRYVDDLVGRFGREDVLSL
jgi:hypothetical protein